MSHSFHLFQLQKIDSQIDQGSARIREINAKIDGDQRVQDAQSQLEAAQAALKAAEASLKKIEQESAAKRVKLEQEEATLYGGKVKVPKELQDLQHEVASIKRAIALLEDQQLDAMMLVDESQAKYEAKQRELIRAQSEFASDHAVLLGESGMLQTLSDRLQAERAAVVNQIPVAILEAYDRLRKSKRGVAVAIISDNGCSACGTELTAADRQTARSPVQEFHCPSCGRFIYGG
ncbi:MAG TPA: hypothetical protein VN364_03560 [Bellilinea sp.]|nr:hypothetical protein [Bellilinea sp.]